MTGKLPSQITSLQDLADLAGVSRATASRALNDSPLVSQKTRERLRLLARQHNFTVNRQARDFRLRRTSVVSVVFMLDPRSDQHMSDPFFLEMLGGIADSLAAFDHDLLLSHAPIPDLMSLRDSRVLSNADGVIFVGQGDQHEELNEVAELGTPVVVWGAPVPQKRYLVVGSDNERGGYAASRHLLDLGRRKLAFLGNTRNAEIDLRFRGYDRALREAGLKSQAQLLVDVPFDMSSARETIGTALDEMNRVDALVCASDTMAFAAISALAARGLSVPEDVAVVGYDDISLAAYGVPPLTTVRQNIRFAGRVLVESIMALINGDDVTDTQLSSELIVRSSCGASQGNTDA